MNPPDLAQLRKLISAAPRLLAICGADWEHALATARIMRMAAGTATQFCSNDVDSVNIVLQGSMKVRASSADGRTFSLYHLGAGEVCLLSLAFVYAEEKLQSDVQVESDLLVWQLPRSEFEALLASNAGFRDFIMAGLSDYVVKLLGLVEQAHFGSLQSRLLDTLQQMKARTGSTAIAITHQALADELGSSREVISRLLKTLERDGSVALGRKSITLGADAPAPAAARAKGKTSPGSAPSRPAAR